MRSLALVAFLSQFGIQGANSCTPAPSNPEPDLPVVEAPSDQQTLDRDVNYASRGSYLFDVLDEEILALLDDDPADIIVCGATHVPFQRTVGEYHVVNVGSVGAAPEGKIAHYTVLTPKMSGADILQDWVSYEDQPEAS